MAGTTPAYETWSLWAGIAAALLSCMAVGCAAAWARSNRMLALPDARASHAVATPTGGGAGLVAAMVLLASLPGYARAFHASWLPAVVPGLVILGILGWVDDQRRLPAFLRLVVQFAVSAWLIAYLCLWSGPGTLAVSATPLNVAVALLALTWMMNAYNFMDGSDGMAGAQGVFGGLILGALMLLSGAPGLAIAGFSLAGACLGFLPWNFPRARVFMGDAGSVPVGFALGALILLAVSARHLPLAAGLLVMGVFLTDASLTLLRRFLRGERWYTAHRQHAYQRLIAAGWPHSRVLVLYQAINLVLVLPAVVLGALYPNWAWPLTGTVYLVLVTLWLATSLKHGGAT